MQALLPSLLAIHLIGMVMWLGPLLVQAIVMMPALDENRAEVNWHLLDLIAKMNKYLINAGSILSLLSGVAMILIHGREWFAPRYFIHIKITLYITAMGLMHIGFGRLKKAQKLLDKSEMSPDDEGDIQGHIKIWKLFQFLVIILLTAAVVIAVSKLGMV